MSKVIYLPFENLPQRYTQMWNESFISVMSKDDIVVNVDNEEKTIEKGEFLDICGTVIYKQRQIAKVAELFESGIVEDGDVFFVPDIFYPALESIRYMSELIGIKVFILAFNHAGRADEDDFVQRLREWSDTQEQAWHDMCDVVFVGSYYHKERVRNKFNHARIVVSGAIWDNDWMDNFTKGISRKKEDYVIFPHRPCKEKRFKEFLQVAEQNPKLKFIITSSGKGRIEQTLPCNVSYIHSLTKREYYEIFAKADKYLSLAKQETFGYTLQEAIYFGCKVIVPNNACYKEYAHNNCVINLEDIMQRDNLTKFYNNINLTKSKNIDNNSKGFYNICSMYLNELR